MENLLCTELTNQELKPRVPFTGKTPPMKLIMDLTDYQFRVTETYVFTTERMYAFGQATPGHRPQTAHII